MAVVISGVVNGSAAFKTKIEQGDVLLKINGNEIMDVLDYRFYENERKVVLLIQKQNGKQKRIVIRKDEDDEIGLLFDTYLMDKQRSCKNNCIFCFI